MLRRIPRAVWVLSLVSFFTDVSSEMLYPVMPVYLKSIGFTFIGIGILEGIAEAIAGLSKIYFGRISDRYGNYNTWVSVGYGHSFLSKLLLALSSNIYLIFASRLIDRLGKGIRTAPRDAILALSSNDKNQATIFALHRSMDTMGAAVGPVIALIVLYNIPEGYRTLFAIAAVPALIGVFLTFAVNKVSTTSQPTGKRISLFAALSGKGIRSTHFFKALAPLLLFALINSSDAFLLLKMKSAGWDDTHVIGAYIIYNIAYALLAFPIGILADKIGIKPILITGLLFFGLSYAGFSYMQSEIWFYVLFGLYSIYAACMESNSKAFLSQFLGNDEKAGGLGFMAGWQSIALLLASVWTGYLWQSGQAQLAFIISATVAGIAAFWLLLIRSNKSIIK